MTDLYNTISWPPFISLTLLQYHHHQSKTNIYINNNRSSCCHDNKNDTLLYEVCVKLDLDGEPLLAKGACVPPEERRADSIAKERRKSSEGMN